MKGFVEADQRPRPVPLARRVAEHLAGQGGLKADAARFEAWLREPPATDLDAERFGALPEATPTEGTVRVNLTLRRGTFERAAVDRVLGDTSESPDVSVPLVAIRWDGEPRVLEETPEIAAALAAAGSGRLEGAVTEALLERGFVVWFPTPR